MDLNQILGLRRRRDQRPEPQRVNEQLPARGGIGEVGDAAPRSKAQNESESAADAFRVADNELFVSAITGTPCDEAATGAVPCDDAKDFANRITR